MPSKDLIFNIIGVDRASKTFEKVGSKADGVGSKLAKFGVVGVAAFAAVGVAAFELGKKSVDAFQETATAALSMQRILGGTAESASRLNFAAEETGVAQDKLTVGIKTLSTHLNANDKAWKMTGLSVRDAKGQLLTTTAALPKLADIFAKMPAGAEKTALAVKLFGKSGIALIPLLNRGSAGLAALNEESDKLGHTLSGPQVAAVHKVVLAHREFSAAVSGVEIQLGAALYPALTKVIPQVSAFAASFAEKAIPVVKEFGVWFQDKLLPALDQAWKQIMPGVSKAFQDVGQMLGGGKGGWEGVGNAITGFIKVASQVTSVVLPLMIRLWGVQIKTYQVAYKIIAAFGNVAIAAFNGIAAAARASWKAVSPVLSAMDKSLGATIALLQKAGIINNKGGKFVLHTTSVQVRGGKQTVASAMGRRNYQGDSLVGEDGPEIVRFSRPVDIFSNRQSRAMAASGGGSVVHNHYNTINLSGMVGDKRALGKQLLEALQALQGSTGRPLPINTT